MTAIVTIWSDLHCPWSLVAIHRQRKAREKHDLDVVFDLRAWPLELVNQRGTPRHIVEPETAVLANHEPELFSKFDQPSWPSTFLPAFELVAATRRLLGFGAAEDVDYHLRLRFFRHTADVSQRHELRQAVVDAGLDADAVMDVWESQPVRADVLADFVRSQELPIKGSPQVFWPDGSATHNPGITMEVVRGIPRVLRDDPDEPDRLLTQTLAKEQDYGTGR
jgi:predicted DsbA family dithiol-disulfide isomerase